MVLYTKDNIDKLYLSPYVDMIFCEEGTICRNRLNRMSIAAKVKESVFKRLAQGLALEELMAVLKETGIEKEEATTLVKVLIQKGVIE